MAFCLMTAAMLTCCLSDDDLFVIKEEKIG